jgi:pilus assembly protein CpaC
MVFSAVLQVTHNLSKLQDTVKRVSPESEITFRSVEGGLVMEGTALSVEEAAKVSDVASAFVGEGERVVNMVKTSGSEQVTLQVRIVELQRNSLKDFGINLQNVTVNGEFAMQILQGEDITQWPNNVITTPLHTLEPSSLIVRGSNLNNNFYFKYKNMGALIDALETQGLATVLAEPSLTTTSGKAASFLAGGQFPLPVAGSDGNVTLQYQPFGVSLNFTPMVMSKERISLTVAPEVSTLDFNNPIQVDGITYPILSTRKASSVVELGSGQSFMLAGLLQKEVAHTIRKFPGLGNLPVLGTLFSSQSFQNDQSELVIIVTPYIVQPVSDRAKLQVPTDGYVPPNDLQRLLRNNLYQQEPMDDDSAANHAVVAWRRRLFWENRGCISGIFYFY